jgi:hypothetical protein
MDPIYGVTSLRPLWLRFDSEGQRPIAFSILVNNAAGYVSTARAYQEKLVTSIANFLH